MSKVLIAPAKLVGLPLEYVDVLKNGGFELVYNTSPSQLSEDQLMEALTGVVASLAGSEPYTERIFAAHPQLKVVARVGVGYDAVDLEAATEAGAAVAIVPGTNQGAVAEHTFLLMLALAKRLLPQHYGMTQGSWLRGATIPLRTQTLGLIGLGRIGKAVATRALAFEMKVIAHDPIPDVAWAESRGIPLVSLDELLRESDFVSLHLPAMVETTHLINSTTLSLMKPTAFLINTSRGALVNEADLCAALREKRIAGAGLDVFECEPPGKMALCELDNVVLTPHAAGVDLRSRDEMTKSAAEAIVSLSKGEWPTEKIVNPSVRERFRW